MIDNPRCPFSKIELKVQQSLYFLAQDMFPRFLNSRFGFALVKQLRAREIAGEKVRLSHYVDLSVCLIALPSGDRNASCKPTQAGVATLSFV